MKLGLVAFGTATGLGYQTKAIYDHMRPERTLLIDLSAKKRLPLHPEWFPGATIVQVPTAAECARFVRNLDVIFMCETPMNWNLIDTARRAGVRTVVQPNFEFLDHLRNPELPRPTIFAAPSEWRIEDIRAAGLPVEYLPMPVDDTALPQRDITEAGTLLHIAGRVASHDRNGTADFLAAAVACRGMGARWILHTQTPPDLTVRRLAATAGVEIRTEVQDPSDLYADGDVLVLPRRYCGLCLPAQEAIACGIPVIMPDIDPNNRWMPPEWLVPAHRTGSFRARVPIDLHSVDPAALEAKIRAVHTTPGMAREWHLTARDLGKGMTWGALKPRYESFLDRVMELEP